jgi:WD40 repeat protein
VSRQAFRGGRRVSPSSAAEPVENDPSAVVVAAAATVAGILIARHLSSVPGPEATLTDPVFSIDGVASVAFSPAGATLATGDASGTTYLWKVAGLHLAMSLADPPQNSGGVSSVAFSPNGSLLAAGDSDGSTYLWRTPT